jgi:hypothetical protein
MFHPSVCDGLRVVCFSVACAIKMNTSSPPRCALHVDCRMGSVRQVVFHRDFQKILNLHSSGHPFLRLLATELETICSNFPISVLARLASAHHLLRFVTADPAWLFLLLQKSPAKTALQTRRQFLLPVDEPLVRFARGMYSQSAAFQAAMYRHYNLDVMRAAFLLRQRRQQANLERVMRYEGRLSKLRGALLDAKLSPSLMWTSLAGLRFRCRAKWFSDSLLEILVQTTVDTLCWQHYLEAYTDYRSRFHDHVNIFGDYEGAAQNVSKFYHRPAAWPWQ